VRGWSGTIARVWAACWPRSGRLLLTPTGLGVARCAGPVRWLGDAAQPVQCRLEPPRSRPTGLLVDGGVGADRPGLAQGDGVAELVAVAGADGRGQPEPRSRRAWSAPRLAPARRTRAATSSTNLAVPRPEARPVRWRAREHLAAVSTSSEQRMLAEGVGEPEVAPCWWSPCTSHTVASRSMVMGLSPGPAPAAHALARTVSASRSSWRTCPKVKARRRSKRGGGNDLVAQHLAGGAAAQQVGVEAPMSSGRWCLR
jgi:hypothetical protein